MRHLSIVLLAGYGFTLAACSGTQATDNPSGVGGDWGWGGANTSGGASSSAGGSSGKPTGGNVSGGGISATGGTKASGGASSTGGSAPTGGAKLTGGASTTGGTKPTGGASTTGGSSNATSSTGGAATGGAGPSGGSRTTGGSSNPTSSAGGTAATGGSTSVTGGAATGGTQGTGGATVSVDCTDSSTASGTFTVRYDAAEIPVTGKQKSYIAHTNWWHKYTSQSIAYNGLSFKITDSANTSVPASDGAPTGFPSMFIGSYSGNASKGSNLPKLVSSIQSVPTIFSTDSSAHDTTNFNATYDVWFTASSSPLPTTASDPGGDGALLMVWLFKPADRQPRGGTAGKPDVANHTVAGVSQATWDVWLGAGSTTRAPCVSYVSTTPLDSLSFDLNKFIQDAVANNYYVKSTMNLSIVFAGFEIWAGGDGLQLKQYCAQVN